MYLTETELLEKQEQNLFILDQILSNKKYSLDEIAEFLPGILHLNSLNDLSLKYVNQKGQDYFDLSTKEMINLGEKHMIENYHPTTFTELIPRIMIFARENNENKIFGYTQFLRKNVKSEFECFVGFLKISKKLNCFICLENPTGIFGDFTHKMNRILDDNEFLRKNYQKFSKLSKREVEIMQLIGAGNSRNHISGLLNISKHTLDTHRKNIRKKLDIKTTAELFRYIYAFDLV